jgi:hypothetical protein
MALDIIGECGLPKIYKALIACEKLRRVALSQSDKKRMFTDNGKQVTYACVGPQVSRNSKCVLDNLPFMDNLTIVHWESLVWLMKHAEGASVPWQITKSSVIFTMQRRQTPSRHSLQQHASFQPSPQNILVGLSLVPTYSFVVIWMLTLL